MTGFADPKDPAVGGAGFAAVAVVGNPRPASRTAALAGAVLAAVTADVHGAPSGEVVDLGVLLGSVGAPLGSDSAQRYAQHLATLHTARFLVVATPTYKGSYTGLLKSFLDHVAAGALRDIVAVPVTTVGSPAHTLAADVHLRPLLLELGASVPTAALVVRESDLDEPAGVIEQWLDRERPLLRRLLASDHQDAASVSAGAVGKGIR
jgi:FMN reductase